MRDRLACSASFLLRRQPSAALRELAGACFRRKSRKAPGVPPCASFLLSVGTSLCARLCELPSAIPTTRNALTGNAPPRKLVGNAAPYPKSPTGGHFRNGLLLFSCIAAPSACLLPALPPSCRVPARCACACTRLRARAPAARDPAKPAISGKAPL